MKKPTRLSGTEARAGRASGHVLLILIVSGVLAVLAAIALYTWFYARTTPGSPL